MEFVKSAVYLFIFLFNDDKIELFDLLEETCFIKSISNEIFPFFMENGICRCSYEEFEKKLHNKKFLNYSLEKIENKISKYDQTKIKLFKISISKELFNEIISIKISSNHKLNRQDIIDIFQLPFLSYFDHYEKIKECLLKHIIEDESIILACLNIFCDQNTTYNKKIDELRITILYHADLSSIYRIIQDKFKYEIKSTKNIILGNVIFLILEILEFVEKNVEFILYDGKNSEILNLTNNFSDEKKIVLHAIKLPKFMEICKIKHAVFSLIDINWKKVISLSKSLKSIDQVIIDVSIISNFLSTDKKSELEKINSCLVEILNSFIFKNKYQNIYIKLFKMAFKILKDDTFKTFTLSDEKILLNLNKFDKRMLSMAKLKYTSLNELKLSENTILSVLLNEYLNNDPIEYGMLKNSDEKDVITYNHTGLSSICKEKHVVSYSFQCKELDAYKIYHIQDVNYLELKFNKMDQLDSYSFLGFFSMPKINISSEVSLNLIIAEDSLFVENSSKIKQTIDAFYDPLQRNSQVDKKSVSQLVKIQKLDISSYTISCFFLDSFYFRQKHLVNNCAKIFFFENNVSIFNSEIFFLSDFSATIHNIMFNNCDILSNNIDGYKIQSSHKHKKMKFSEVNFLCDLTIDVPLQNLSFQNCSKTNATIFLPFKFDCLNVSNSYLNFVIENCLELRYIDNSINDLTYQETTIFILGFKVITELIKSNCFKSIGIFEGEIKNRTKSPIIIDSLGFEMNSQTLQIKECLVHSKLLFQGYFSMIYLENIKGEGFNCELDAQFDDFKILTTQQKEKRSAKNPSNINANVRIHSKDFMLENIYAIFEFEISKKKKLLSLKNGRCKIRNNFIDEFYIISLENICFTDDDFVLNIHDKVTHIFINNSKCKLQLPNSEIICCNEGDELFFNLLQSIVQNTEIHSKNEMMHLKKSLLLDEITSDSDEHEKFMRDFQVRHKQRIQKMNNPPHS